MIHDVSFSNLSTDSPACTIGRTGYGCSPHIGTRVLFERAVGGGGVGGGSPYPPDAHLEQVVNKGDGKVVITCNFAKLPAAII